MSVVTYADLKQDIVTDLNRDDLTDVVAASVESVIRSLQRQFFYPAPTTSYVTCTIGNAFVDIPDDMVNIYYARMKYGNIWRWLSKVEYERLLHVDVVIPPVQSVPTLYAPYDSQIRLYPVPNDYYDIELTGNQKIAIPTADDTSNFWTTQASDVVKFLTLAQIYATRIKDDARAQQYFAVAEQHRLGLVRETTLKTSQGRVRAWW